jgi:hypothetical protein
MLLLPLPKCSLSIRDLVFILRVEEKSLRCSILCLAPRLCWGHIIVIAATALAGLVAVVGQVKVYIGTIDISVTFWRIMYNRST